MAKNFNPFISKNIETIRVASSLNCIFFLILAHCVTMPAHFSMRKEEFENEEFPTRKTGEKNEELTSLK